MRILNVYPIFPPNPQESSNGITQVIYSVSKKLVDRGHSVEVFAANAMNIQVKLPKESKETVVDGISVSYFRSLANYRTYFITPSILVALRRKAVNFDIIHIHDFRTFQGPIAACIADISSIPYVLQAHGSLPRNERATVRLLYDKIFGRRLLEQAAGLVALTESEAQMYKLATCDSSKISVISNGVDLDNFESLPLKGNFRKRWGISEHTKIILFIGRLHWVKGIDFLLSAVSLMLNEIQIEFKVVLSGPDDGYLSTILELVRDKGIDKYVRITGPLYGNSKLEAYVDADVVVLPSRYETFPMTVLEAYACRKAVVSSDVGNLRDIVINGKTGYLVQFGDSEELASTFVKLLPDDSMIHQMGEGGRQFVEDRFTLDKTADELERLYLKIICSRKS